MSSSLLRLRRATLSLSSVFLNKPISSLSSTLPLTPSNPTPTIPTVVSHFRAFRASNIYLARPRNAFQNDNDDFKIGPDDILFEGCDYNHWLITMDFPKDPRPSSEEMVQTYVETAAKIFGSVEEAKKKIYACSTTTYQGFQVECSEETSKKFEGLPGVVFILPDSYIDPVNKQYGGDKYDNGFITPRPPPTQYGRTGGRFGDRNRDSNRPMRPRGEFNQGNPAYDNRSNTVGSAGNFGPTQHPPPQQNYGPPGVAPMNNSAGGQENYQGYRRDQMSPNQGNYNQGQRGNLYPQGPSVPPVNLNNNAPPPQPPQSGNFSQGVPGQPPVNFNNNAPPPQSPQSGNFGRGAPGSYNQGAPGSYNQGAPGSYGQGAPGSYGQGAPGSYGQGAPGSYGQGAPGSYGQGSPGSYGQGAPGNYSQGAPGSYRQVAPSSYGQGSPGSYVQGAAGSYTQGASGNHRQGASGYEQDAGNYGQGGGGYFGQAAAGSLGHGGGGQEKFPNFGRPDSVHEENQRFSQGEQMDGMRQVPK
ncbi:hypothetical protein DCAR_0933695 [Daucus carota subsp. sativus]|uniref:MORF/ORRM1/DAG-like MORF domain-containing protein n=1 Tax=Daucus carota subsp. sativus TaxID=79200 RepID=A0AAF1BC34_DAUCS|nr:hypothetical protein DCAR_0933695 [Daucus carota subsp. sativus]